MEATYVTQALTAGTLAHNAKAADTVAEVGTDGYVLEPKMDGWRLLAHRHDAGVTFYARSGKTWDFPEAAEAIAAAFPAGSVLDGEAVALDDDWGSAQSGLTGGNTSALTYTVFDLVAHGGIDARPLGFGDRRALLERIFDGEDFGQALSLVEQLAASDDALETLIAQGYEGGMLKKLSARYASGKRGAGLHKLKAVHTEDVVITGFKPGENGFAGLVGALEFGQYDAQGNLVAKGRCSGMDMKTRLEISHNQEAWLGRVVEVRHMGLMNGGGWRHPQYKRTRLDKTPAECIEQ